MAALDPLDQITLSLTTLNLNPLPDPNTATVTAPPAEEQSTTAAGSTSLMIEAVLPDDLIAEILSYLSVKTLIQLRSVCKAWKTLISNPTFVNLHLQRSPRNALLTLLWVDDDENFTNFPTLLSVFPVRRILDNLVDDEAFCNGVELKRYDPYDGGDYSSGYNRIVGSCNGLLCFCSRKVTGREFPVDSVGYQEYWLNFQNLATGTISEKLGCFLESGDSGFFYFSFGYDNSTETYKVVAFRLLSEDYDPPSMTSEVKIFNLGDNSWRNIQSFPLPPLICCSFYFGYPEPLDAAHLFGTVNWLALNTVGFAYDWKYINAENFVILSLSLSTETYTQLLLPKAFNEPLHVQPTLRVLRNCLCFSHDFRGTEFVIWLMREFGVPESWTQLIRVSYQTLGRQNLPMGNHIYNFQLLPLYLSKDSDTLIFANFERDNPAFIYYREDNRVERIRYSKDVVWFSTMDYVESLVQTP